MTHPLTHFELEATWEEIRKHLESKKQQIAAEILHYPPPIPACDAQFNFLLEERTRIGQEIGRLAALAQESQTHPDPQQLVKAFVLSSTDIDNETKQKFRANNLSIKYNPLFQR